MVVGDRLVDVPKCALHPTEPLHNYFLFVNRMIKNLFIFRLSLRIGLQIIYLRRGLFIK